MTGIFLIYIFCTSNKRYDHKSIGKYLNVWKYLSISGI